MSIDPLLEDFNRMIKQTTKSKETPKEIRLITIVIERKTGGYLARIVAGRDTLFNKARKEFVNSSVDELFEDLKQATKKAFRLIPRESGVNNEANGGRL